jgi:hypothetical protein
MNTKVIIIFMVLSCGLVSSLPMYNDIKSSTATSTASTGGDTFITNNYINQTNDLVNVCFLNQSNNFTQSLGIYTNYTTEFIIGVNNGTSYRQTFRNIQGSSLAWHWGTSANESEYFSILLGGGQNRMRINNRDFNLFNSEFSKPFIFVNATSGESKFKNITADNICYTNGTGCPVSSGGNASWNQSYANTLYAPIGSGSTGSNTDIDANVSNEWVMFESFTNNGAIETGEVGLYGWNYVATGGSVAVNTPYTGNHPGVIRLSTATSVNGNASMDLGIATNIIDTYTGNFSGTWVVNMSNPSDSANNYTLYIGFHDSTGTTRIPVDGIYFMTNTTYPNWTAVSSSNSVRTFNDTNWRVNGSWVKLRIDVNNASGVYEKRYYINNQQVAVQGATNLPLEVARTFGTAVQLYKQGGATARTLDIDYYYFKQRFAIPR